MERNIRISDYDYPLPEGRIAKFPLERREQSKLLVCRDGRIADCLLYTSDAADE